MGRLLGVGPLGGKQVDEPSVSHVAPSSPNGLPEGSKGGPSATRPEPGATAAALPGASPLLAGLDLVHIGFDDEGTTAPLPNQGVARLSVDPALQRIAQGILAGRHLPEAAIVMVDPVTGRVLVYASHVESGGPRDLCARAIAPAASVFKVVTGTALVDTADMGPETRECYAGGGEQRIVAGDLEENPRRDRWCITLSNAMGRSINPVFARLALRRLKPKDLELTAQAYGFGQKVPFDVDVEPSALQIPGDRLEYARTAAGFFHTTLSPLQAAAMSTTLARGGEAIRLHVVREALDAQGKAIYTEPDKPSVRRVLKPETAQAVVAMMEHTVTEGTAYRAFRDSSGRPFLRGIPVAGKTGTLSDHETGRLFTWFTGFAPSHAVAVEGDVKPVAIAVLVVNNPAWNVKANVVAREMLRAYFAQQNLEHITAPGAALSGRRPRRRAALHALRAGNENSENQGRDRDRDRTRVALALGRSQPVLSATASSRPRTSSR
ncbi:penicillin-binding transpeptidase domain-containing protein [Pendulispora albinea]|uniref:Penicillin-binding protein n=1 Tax=Pendulispora albinea TaxID=2741071 RepID=A0ABZ2LUB5_9BACT